MNARTVALVVLMTTASAFPAAAQLRVIPYSGLFSAPVAFVQDPSDPTVQLVVEQRGMIWALKNGEKQPTPFLDLRTETLWALELGMLGLALAPDYQATGRLYITFSSLPDGHTVVARFRRSSGNPLVADPASRFDLRWASEGGQRFITQPSQNHKGGQLAFGSDGYLYIGLGDGDGDSSGDPDHRAQNPQTLLGKMLRIDVSVPDADTTGYRVPADNPFVDAQPIAALPEIWAFGLRNPWRWTFDEMALGGTGALIMADVGLTSWEEIDYEPRGAGGRNYGWRNREGAHPSGISPPPAYLPLTDPIHEYTQSGGASISGGQVYRGTALGDVYRGRYFYADYISRRLWSIGLALTETGEATVTNEIEHTADLGVNAVGSVSAFGIDYRGELYVVGHSLGMIFRVLLDTQPAPTVTGVVPGTSPFAGGASLTITGTNFISGATVSIGGVAGIDPVVTSATILRVTAPPRAAGTVDIVVTNPDGQQATLSGAFVYALAGVKVTKSASDEPVLAGGNLTYTIRVSNDGPSNAASVVLSDTLPSEVVFNSLPVPAGWTCSAPGVGSTGTITCTRPTMPPGSDLFAINVSVGPHRKGTVISNAASVTSTTSDPDSADNSSVALSTIRALADLSMAKRATPDPVAPGSAITYTLTLTNAGPSSAFDITVLDAMPSGTTFQSFTAPAGWTCTTPAVGATGVILCQRSSALAVGATTFSLVALVHGSAAPGSIITNPATVTTTGTDDPNPANDAATASTTVVAADLMVTKIDTPDPVSAGSVLTYAMTVTNRGPNVAANASFTDQLASDTTFESVSAASGWNCSAPAVGTTGTVTCTIQAFAPGIALFSIVGRVRAGVVSGTVLSNTVTVQSSTGDPDTGNNIATATTAVTTSANLFVTTGDAPDPVVAGTLLTYSLTVGNAGPSDATAPTLIDALPAGTTFESLVAPAGWICTSLVRGAPGTLNCSTAALVPGASDTFTVVVHLDAAVPAGTVITNSATVNAATPDPITLNNTASATTTAAAGADLAVTNADSPDPVFRGQVATYTITVVNKGPSVATAVTLSNLLPAETRFESMTAPAGWTCTVPLVGAVGAITCARATLAPGTAVFTLLVRVDPGITAGTFTNTVAVAGSSIDPIPANNIAAVTTAMRVLAYHFAEGAGGFFQTFLLVGNPNLVETPIVVQTLDEVGTTTTQTDTVPPESRRTIALQPSASSFAFRVLSPAGLPLSIDRSMFFNAFSGGHTQQATQPSQTWWFAEGSQKTASSASAPAFARVATWLLLANEHAVPASVTVRYILEDGGEIVRPYTVASFSRFTISPAVIPALTDRSFGMVVTSDVPITADRSMYFASDYREGHSSAGMPALSTAWLHAEGTVGPDFDTYILLLNPTATPATVTLTFRPDGGSPIVKTHVIPPNTRLDVSLEHEDPGLASLSTLAVWTQVTSDVPIASERATYGPGPFETWRFAHASAGIGASATRWGLAEGVVGLAPKFATYYLIANPHPTATAQVLVRFLKSDGTVLVLPVSVPPLERVTVDAGAWMPALVNQSFAAVVESTNGVGIAVERSTFWTVPAGLAASSSPGVPLPPSPP